MQFRPTLLAAAIAATSSLSYAEETSTVLSEDNLLDTLEVKGQTYRNTATKTQLVPEETPQAISIISSEELNEKAAESLSEAVRYSSGINTELRGGAITRFDLFNIRGFDNDTVLYDGLPLLFNDWNLQPQIDASAIEQIEIFKGPTSTLYGSMPPGGMVNIISKSPQKEAKNSIEITAGSDNKQEVQFDSTGSINNKVNYRVTGLARQQDGQAETTEAERITIAPSLDIKVSNNTLLNLNLYYQNDPSAGSYSSLPSLGSLYKNSSGQLNSDAYLGDVNWETYEREVFLFGYKLDHTINNTWNFLQNVRFTIAESYLENTYSLGLESEIASYLDSTYGNTYGFDENDDSTMYRSIYSTDESSKGINIDNQLSALFDVGDTEHNVLLGVDYLYLNSDVVYKDTGLYVDGLGDGYGLLKADFDLYSIDIFDPDNSSIDSNSTLYTYTDSTLRKEQLGFYVQDQVRLNKWVLIAGGRYDFYKAEDLYENETEQNQFSGRVGALYQFDNGVSPFINFAQSFEPESGEDTNGDVFETSTADQVEAGIKYQQNGLLASITAFHIIKSNVVMNDPNGGAYDLIQVGETTSKGLELELKQAISKELSLSAAYTLQDIKITKDSTNGIEGNTPIWTPEQQFSTWLNYRPTGGSMIGASFGAGLRYIGKTQIDAENSDTVPSYALVDLSVGYDLAQLSADWKGASVQLSVTNAFDEVYYSCYDTSNCWYGADRSFELTGRYEF
jgi:iron complex outermembrane receptor protein